MAAASIMFRFLTYTDNKNKMAMLLVTLGKKKNEAVNVLFGSFSTNKELNYVIVEKPDPQITIVTF